MNNSKPTIYDQHDAAFARVSAFVIVKDGKKVATVAFKFPADGAGRLYAYVHWLGVPMVRGMAGGYGYDKKSAACAAAARKAVDPIARQDREGLDVDSWDAFRSALAKDDGYGWERNLESAGFKVWSAV